MAQGDGVSAREARTRRRNLSAPEDASTRGRSAGQRGARAELAMCGETPNEGPSRNASALRRSARLSRQPPDGGAPSGSDTPTPNEPRRRTQSTSARGTPSSGSGLSSVAFPVAGPSSLSPSPTSLPPRTPQKPKETPDLPNPTDSTPVTARSDAKLALPAQGERDRDSIYMEHCQRSEGTWIGPVPDMDFLEKCVHDGHRTRTPKAWEARARKWFKNVPAQNGEAAFCEALKKSGVCKKLVPLDTHSFRVDDVNNPESKYGPDIFTVSSTDGLLTKGVLRQRTTISKGVSFGDQKQKREDPCGGIDGTVPVLPGAAPLPVGEPTVHALDTKPMRKSRGQLTVYATVMFSNSHRTKVYGFVLMEDQARLLLFDHSAVVYSSLFNWKTTGILLAFHARIDAMTPAQYGWDTSTELITKWAECQLVKDAKKILEDSDALPVGMTADSLFPTAGKPGPYTLFRQYDSRTQTFHRIIAFKPLDYEDSGLIGSDARWWLAVDLDDEILVYYKDSWRIDLPNMPSETETYAKLAEAGVSHILKFHRGGDVPVDTDRLYEKFMQSSRKPSERRLSNEDHANIEYQKTFTYQFCKDNGCKRNVSVVGQVDNRLLEIVPRTHHRIFFTTIPTKLVHFSSTRQLVSCISDAITAHRDAYEKAGLLHRKIDGHSVVIDKDGHGYLTNWEQAKSTDDIDTCRTNTRPGSLQIMAAEVLQNFLDRPHVLRHDLEAFFYLLCYTVLRYRPLMHPGTSLPQPIGSDSWTRLLADLRKLFDEGSPNALNQLVAAGNAKATWMAGQGNNLPVALLKACVKPSALCKLILSGRRMFQPIYVPAPELDFDPTDSEKADHEKEHRLWVAGRTKAEENLTSVAFQAHFTQALTSNPELWPQNDGAVDQYPPFLRSPSDGAKAYGGNPANALMTSTVTGEKRQRVESYTDGTGRLFDVPHKRRRVGDGDSETQVRDEDEDEDEDEDPDDMRLMWTASGH